MPRSRFLLGACLGALTAMLVPGGSAAAQIPASQRASVIQHVGRGQIEVTYHRPTARGRELFGSLVPWGTPWTPGANDATKITFSRDVHIDDQPVPAGAYSIWLIPDSASAWTLILSTAADVFHTPYPEGRDALRLRVTPRTGEHMETLSLYFPLVDRTRAELRVHWGRTFIPLAIEMR